MNDKQLVWEYWNTCNGERKDEIATDLRKYLCEDTFYQGPHPVNDLNGTGALYSGFWGPFLRSFPDVVREPYLFMGGEFKGEQWGKRDRLFPGDVCGRLAGDTGHRKGDRSPFWGVL